MVEKFKLVPVGTKKEEAKKNEKKSMGKGYFSMESAEVNGKKVYICVFRNLIGKTLYTGTVSPQFSKKRRIEEKAIKLQLKLALVSKDGNKIKVDYCVISFARSDDLKEFEEKFEEAMSALKEQAGKPVEKAVES